MDGKVEASDTSFAGQWSLARDGQFIHEPEIII
jgi:hypothetical protein